MPLHYGLIDKATILDQRYSTTMDEDSFARESLSIWTGGSREAWLDNKQLLRHRNLLKCERKAQVNPTNKDTFYMIGVKLHLPRHLVTDGQ